MRLEKMTAVVTGGAVVFLASNESSFITGSDIKVEGGWLAARARVGEETIVSD